MVKQFYLEHTREWNDAAVNQINRINGKILPSKLLNQEGAVGTLYPTISFRYCGSQIIAQNRDFYWGIVGVKMSDPYTLPDSDNYMVIDVVPIKDEFTKADIKAVLRKLNHKPEIHDYFDLLLDLYVNAKHEEGLKES